MRRSAGLLPFRLRDPHVEVLIGHPGGPLWQRRDAGAWSIIKGEMTDREEPWSAARREFTEETGWPPPEGRSLDLGVATLRSGKQVQAWAVEGDLDPAEFRPGTFTMEWPPLSGRRVQFPEVDRIAWCAPDEARRLLNPSQAVFIDRLLAELGNQADRPVVVDQDKKRRDP